MTTVSITKRDYSDEPTTTSFRLADTTAGNYASLAGLTTAGQASYDLKVAMDNLQNGAQNKVIYNAYTLNQGRGPSTDTNSQREDKLVFFGHDATNFDAWDCEVGCIDLTAVTRIPSTDLVELTDGGAVEAMVTAIQTHVKSKTLHAIVVDKAQLQGRNI